MLVFTFIRQNPDNRANKTNFFREIKILRQISDGVYLWGIEFHSIRFEIILFSSQELQVQHSLPPLQSED